MFEDIKVRFTPQFRKYAPELMAEEAIQELIDYLYLHPEQGDLIQGTGGLRKIRWKTGKDNRPTA